MKKLNAFLILLGLGLSARAQTYPGLVAWYKLDGNTEDSSGLNNKGYPGSGVSLSIDRNGGANKCYSFDGTSAATIDAFASASLNANSMTNLVMSAWAKPVTGSTGQWLSTVLILLDPVSKNNFSLDYDLQTNKFLFDNFKGSTLTLTASLKSTTVNPRDVWYHVAARIDSLNRMQLFINGVLDTATTIAPSKPVDNTLTIGRNPSAGVANNFSFLGSIDDARVYNRYLSDAEMMALYTGINTSVPSLNTHYNKLQAYPNPTHDQIRIGGLKQTTSAAIYDTRGSLLKLLELDPANTMIDLRFLPAGLYLLHVQTAEGSQILKLQKQ